MDRSRRAGGARTREDTSGPGASIVWIIGVAFALGSVAAWLASELVEPGGSSVIPADLPTMDLAPGE